MIALFVFVVLLYTSAECNQYRSDYTFDSSVNGWLKYQRIPAVWHDAWLRCHLEGAVLASPLNTQMTLAMRHLIKAKEPVKDGVFTGIHATFSKGDFMSVEGHPLNKMSLEWMPMEPDNKRNKEDCIYLASNGTIADVNCDEIHPYMCYKEKLSAIELNPCGTIDDGYHLEPRTGSCYKFHRVPRNWTRAFMTCAAENAQLVVVNSEQEAAVLVELFEKNPPESIVAAMRNDMRNVMHVGIVEMDGVFSTIDGKTLDEAGYSLWGNNQPDNAYPGQHCGGIFRQGGHVDDVWCNEQGPFVCEKTPTTINQ